MFFDVFVASLTDIGVTWSVERTLQLRGQATSCAVVFVHLQLPQTRGCSFASEATAPICNDRIRWNTMGWKVTKICRFYLGLLGFEMIRVNRGCQVWLNLNTVSIHVNMIQNTMYHVYPCLGHFRLAACWWFFRKWHSGITIIPRVIPTKGVVSQQLKTYILRIPVFWPWCRILNKEQNSIHFNELLLNCFSAAASGISCTMCRPLTTSCNSGTAKRWFMSFADLISYISDMPISSYTFIHFMICPCFLMTLWKICNDLCNVILIVAEPFSSLEHSGAVWSRLATQKQGSGFGWGWICVICVICVCIHLGKLDQFR